MTPDITMELVTAVVGELVIGRAAERAQVTKRIAELEAEVAELKKPKEPATPDAPNIPDAPA